MDEKDWLLITTLAEEKNVTKTAQKLFMTQPAISIRLQAIETELKTPLFLRGRKITELTAEGEILYSYAKHYLSEFQRIREQIANRNDEPTGVIRIASSHAFALNYLPRLLKAYTTLYPKVEIKVITGNSQIISRLLDSSEVHIGILRRAYNWTEETLYFHSNYYYSIVSAEPIDMEKLPEIPQIHATTDARLEEILQRWWLSHYNKPPKIAFIIDRWDICVKLVREKLGYCILSELYTENLEGLYQYRLDIPETEYLGRDSFACCRTNSLQIKAVKLFWDILAKFSIKDDSNEKKLRNLFNNQGMSSHR